ncbi:hypothetical protein BH11BAC3_BH11BAC3_05080 [soil metagenome]
MKVGTIILMLIIFSLQLFSQNVVTAEFFLDADAGVGNNNLITLSNPQPNGNYNFTIDLSGVSIGYHKLYIRTKDSDGNWSLSSRKNIEVISANSVKQVIAAEYFFDDDPEFGKATAFTISPAGTDIQQNFTADVSSLYVGYHKLYIRTKDIDGNWSLTSRRIIEKLNPLITLISGVEFFFDADPGVGNAIQKTFINPAADSSFTFKIPINQLPEGLQTLYIRAKDSVNGNWSLTTWLKDSVVTSVQSGKWSQTSTWSNNKIPDANTDVLLYHSVDVDITTAICKSLTPYGVNAKCNVEAGKALKITGDQ